MSVATPKYILVQQHIKREIREKRITDRLPGERVLAKELGVSYMTVRKAIYNLVVDGVLYKVPTKGTYVADQTNNGKESRTIGYFLDSGIEAGISSPYYSLIFNALEKEAAEHGYALVYFSDNSEKNFRETLKKLDGVIATCFPRIESYIQEIKDEVPLVVIDNSSYDKGIPSVIIDNFSADVESVDYICSLGHKRIGFMMGLEDSDVGKSRFAGYQRGVAKNDIEFEEALVFRGDYSYEAGIEGAEYFLALNDAPTAIICANDSMALGAMRRIGQAGLNVPRDISIVGFDDVVVASQISPALTTVAAPIDEIVARSFDMLSRLIKGEELESKYLALEAQLVVRDTCAELVSKSEAA